MANFAGAVGSVGAEEFLAERLNYGDLANKSMITESEQKIDQEYNETQRQMSKDGLVGARAEAGATRFAGMMEGVGSAVAGGLGAMGQKGTNMGTTQFSQPHASGIGREALGGYDM